MDNNLFIKARNSINNLYNKSILLYKIEKDNKFYKDLHIRNILWMRTHMITLLWWLVVLLWLVINTNQNNQIMNFWLFCIFMAMSSSLLFLLFNILDIRLIWNKIKYIEKIKKDINMKDLDNNNYTKINEYNKNLNKINQQYDIFVILAKSNDFILILSLLWIIGTFMLIYIGEVYLYIYLTILVSSLLLWSFISIFKNNKWK